MTELIHDANSIKFEHISNLHSAPRTHLDFCTDGTLMQIRHNPNTCRTPIWYPEHTSNPVVTAHTGDDNNKNNNNYRNNDDDDNNINNNNNDDDDDNNKQ